MKLKYQTLLLALLFLSCSKPDERRSGEGGFDQRTAWAYDSADSFWNKQPCVDFQLDTVWMGDTTINIRRIILKFSNS